MLNATPQQLAAIALVQASLGTLNCQPHVTYEALTDKIFCTVHCLSREEKLQVLEALSTIANQGIASSANPDTVTVVIVYR
jgi:hypothetical protein